MLKWRPTTMEHLVWLYLGVLVVVRAIPYPESSLRNSTVSGQSPLEEKVQEKAVTTEEVRYLNRLDDSEGIDSSTPQHLEDRNIVLENEPSPNAVLEKISNKTSSPLRPALEDLQLFSTLKPSYVNNSGELKTTLKEEDEWSGWIYKAFADAMMHFMVRSQEQKCFRDSLLYQQQLKNLTLWATRSTYIL